MILGVGIDLVQISRVEKLYSKYGDRFLLKILSVSEQKEVASIVSRKRKVQYLSKRFVAKESLVKAIGTGFSENSLLRDISIKNNKHGKPYCDLSSKLDNYIKKLFGIKKYSLHLSISDDKDYALANAILEKIS